MRIPAGGQRQSSRLRGEGEPGEYGGPRRLYVVLHVEDDKIFARRGQDLLITVDVSIVQAILGDK